MFFPHTPPDEAAVLASSTPEMLPNSMMFMLPIILAAEKEEEMEWKKLQAQQLPNFVNQEQKKDKKRLRFFLRRADLIANYRLESAWAVIYNNRNDSPFITTMGLDCSTFHIPLDAGFGNLWNSTAIGRSDVMETTAVPANNCHALDAAGGLGLILHYLNSTMPDYNLQQIFGITPAVCSRYGYFGMDILLRCLKAMPEASIKWQKQRVVREYSALIRAHHPLLTKGF
ncbi:Similar to predicted protein [Laccaria bicolor S238N-H82]; acc. no. XP_001889281 [Pyronema omphalodes CBS 100304]|uniref:Uncharacterized protein n=1 Tax=Pyronema omphalodes (strain CBS 100304) TaxID=1076935 RepID=U4L025_PYROM|nr:Similar to predicted protein [Laccaria bicolor S238N-H82]; acc. no. XP_001889281 [Pyronema omphalodes CBS 100304]